MEEQELQEVAPIPVPYNDVRTEQQEFDYELFSEFFKKYNTTQEEKEKLNKSILEYFKSDEFKKYKSEHTLDKTDKENIKSIKESLENIDKFLSDYKKEQEELRTLNSEKYALTEKNFEENLTSLNTNIERISILLFILITALGVYSFWKFIKSIFSNFI